jgi:hypothetical protein
MAQQDEATITVRIPGALKQAVEAVGGARGMTLSGIVRRALEDFLEPSQRVSELPGLSRSFDEFLQSQELRNRQGKALLLVVDDGGHRAVYTGFIDTRTLNGLTGSLVLITADDRDPHVAPWVLLRKNIVGWYSERQAGFGDDLVGALVERGWHPVRYAPR